MINLFKNKLLVISKLIKYIANVKNYMDRPRNR